MRSFQLFRRSRLQKYGEILQRSRLVRGVVLLRRVQQNRSGSIVRGRPTNSLHHSSRARQTGNVRLRGDRIEIKSRRLRLHHDESWVRGSFGIAG